jgi:hypothetical protein
MNDTVLYGSDYLLYYYTYLYDIFVGYPLVVRISILVILTSALVGFVLFIIILLLYRNKIRERKILHNLKVTYRDKIKEIAVDSVIYTPNQIVSILNYDKKRPLRVIEKRLLTRLLVLFKVELIDRLNRANYHNIMVAFDLPQFFEREIQFARVRYKTRILMWIRYLEESVSSAVLIPLLYNRNAKVRKAAQATFMWDSPADPFRFFDNANFDATFRPWDKVDIHNIFENRRRWGKNMPNVTQWIRAPKNESTKSLFASEIRYWGKEDECPYLLDTFFETDNMELRREIAYTLGIFKYRDAEKKLINSYAVQPESVKQAIIESVTLMKSGISLSFLRLAYVDAVDVGTKFVALQGLYNYGIQGHCEFELLERHADFKDSRMFNHIKDPIINHREGEIV